MFRLIQSFRRPAFKITRGPVRTNLVEKVRFYGGHEALTHESIKERVIHILKNYDKVDPNLITDKAHFTKDLKLDSLDTVEVVMAMEEEFHIEIPDFDADELKCVEDIVEYVKKRDDAN